MSVTSAPIRRDVNPALIPEFGLEAGIKPHRYWRLRWNYGANGSPVLIPCVCPPDRDTFIQVGIQVIHELHILTLRIVIER